MKTVVASWEQSSFLFLLEFFQTNCTLQQHGALHLRCCVHKSRKKLQRSLVQAKTLQQVRGEVVAVVVLVVSFSSSSSPKKIHLSSSSSPPPCSPWKRCTVRSSSSYYGGVVSPEPFGVDVDAEDEENHSE